MHMNDYSHVLIRNRIAQRTADYSTRVLFTRHCTSFVSVRDEEMPSEELAQSTEGRL
jgi:hypothetical protein